MKFYRLRSSVTVRLALSLIILCLVVGRASRMSAHNPGFTQSAPTKIASSITINGTIDSAGAETVWAPASQLDLLPNNCADFIANTGQPFNLYSLNDGANLYLAFDIPDTTPSNQDALFLIFDPNHSDGATLGVGDRALHLIFSNTAANNTAPTNADSEHYQVAVAGAWPAPTAGLPAGVDARYSRFSDRWQVEMRLPLAFFPVAAGGTMGAAFLYLNKAGTEDCAPQDGIFDDFYAAFPSALSLVANAPVLNQVMDPSLWGDLNLGPAVPAVGFQPPLCCFSTDIDFTPSAQPFTAGTPVNIRAQVHNLHPTSVANNVNVEIRVHNFGTGGGVISPFPLSTVIPSIAASSSSFSSPVTWPSPPPGIHGCIRAEIKPPTNVNSPYTIAGGQDTAQHNIDVACIPQGQRKMLKFIAFNPEERELRIQLAAQRLLPPNQEGLTFELQQPDRPLRPKEEWPVQLVVTAPANLPITDVPMTRSHLPATAGGTAVPPLRERSGTEPVAVAVKGGARLHLTTSGTVDLDGQGPIPEIGPDGRDVTKELGGERRFLLADPTASKFGGALIGSFDAFATSFFIGSEMTLTAPDKAEKLWLAVNDLDGGYRDNTGAGFDVEISTLAPPQAAAGLQRAAQAQQVTLPQLNIAAVSKARITTGDRSVYNLLTNHGGLTYQFLVVNAKGHATGGFFPPFGLPWWLFYLLLLLLLLVLLLFVWLYRRKSRQQPGHV
jgi:hypothetical protein